MFSVPRTSSSSVATTERRTVQVSGMAEIYIGPPVWAVFIIAMACLTLMTMGILWATYRYDNKEDDYQRNRIIGAFGVLMCIAILFATAIWLSVGWD
jgi:uncharacterized membrane protein YidH (DUF202 family)